MIFSFTINDSLPSTRARHCRDKTFLPRINKKKNNKNQKIKIIETAGIQFNAAERSTYPGRRRSPGNRERRVSVAHMYCYLVEGFSSSGLTKHSSECHEIFGEKCLPSRGQK